MLKENYSLAYKEVIELLKFFSLEDIEKIPKDLLEALIDNMDRDYNYIVDESKPFDEQEMLEETKVIFSIIFRDHWATDNQRKRILAKEANDIRKEEEAKQRKYNENNVFKNKKLNTEDNLLPATIKKENIIIKFLKNIINKIKNGGR